MKNKPDYPYHQVTLFNVADLILSKDETLAWYVLQLAENTLYWNMSLLLNSSAEIEEAEFARWEEEKKAFQAAILEVSARYRTVRECRHSQSKMQEVLVRLCTDRANVRTKI